MVTAMIRPHIVVVAVLALAGCSTNSTKSPTELPPPFTADVAGGPLISGNGYTFVLPRGGAQSKQRSEEVDTMAVDHRTRDDFAGNVSVALHPGDPYTPEEAEESARNNLPDSGVRDISVQDRVQIAGVASAHIIGEASVGSQDYTVEQFYPTRGDQMFIVTFSFGTNVTAKQRTEVIEASLVSWDWMPLRPSATP